MVWLNPSEFVCPRCTDSVCIDLKDFPKIRAHCDGCDSTLDDHYTEIVEDIAANNNTGGFHLITEKKDEKTYDIGVIVGRFQVQDLHEVHKGLIQHVIDKHKKVIILLGVSPLPTTSNNPLDYQTRELMIRKHFPEVVISYVKDMSRDEVWSTNLDNRIKDLNSAPLTVALYGGRDSFIKHYKGRFDTIELEPVQYISGTKSRDMVKVRQSESFREGVIWATKNRFPVNYVTVDIAIFNDDASKILLARKEGEIQYRFVGGFSDPDSPNLEADARREVREEANIEISTPQYVLSQRINDWRYRGEVDSVCTTLFICKYLYGKIQPQDDIVELRWFPVQDDLYKTMLDGHGKMYSELLKRGINL